MRWCSADVNNSNSNSTQMKRNATLEWLVFNSSIFHSHRHTFKSVIKCGRQFWFVAACVMDDSDDWTRVNWMALRSQLRLSLLWSWSLGWS